LLVEKFKKRKLKDLHICNCKKIKIILKLCKDKITAIFCIIDCILKEINTLKVFVGKYLIVKLLQ